MSGLSHEICPRVHEGNPPVGDAHRIGGDRRGTQSQCDITDFSRVETLPGASTIASPQTPTGGKTPKAQLHCRIEVFSRGEWDSLLADGLESTSRSGQAFSRRRRVNRDDLESRAARAEALVQMGELSSARRALEGAAIAPGNEATRAALSNPLRRPPVLRDPIPDDILNVVPRRQFVLDPEEFARNVRSARRAFAAHFGVRGRHRRSVPAPRKTSRGRKSPRRPRFARVWKGDGPSHEQGIRVLGIPVGHVDFCASLAPVHHKKSTEPSSNGCSQQDLQSAWLLLLFCANTRATYSLRGLPPAEVVEFAATHDEAFWQCLSQLLNLQTQSGQPPFQSRRVWVAECVEDARLCPLG